MIGNDQAFNFGQNSIHKTKSMVFGGENPYRRTKSNVSSDVRPDVPNVTISILGAVDEELKAENDQQNQ